MWVLFRLLAALLMFCWRIFKKPRAFEPTFEIEETPVEFSSAVTAYKNRQPTQVTSSIRVEFESGVLFNISRETKGQRFLKSVGIASEYQTGDQHFDEKLFLACDHPIFEACLVRSAEAREILLAIFNTHIHEVSSDGKTLILTTKRELSTDQARGFGRMAVELKQALSVLEASDSGLLRDRFVWRIVLIEAIFGSIAIFAISGIVESFFNAEGRHLDIWSVFRRGLVYAFFAYAFLMAFAVALMRGSSRGAKIIWESAIGLAIVLPLASTTLLADLNRKWDTKPAAAYEFEIENRSSARGSSARKLNRRSSLTTLNYYVHVVPKPISISPATASKNLKFPARVKVPQNQYDVALPGNKLLLKIKPGHFDEPWIEEIVIVYRVSKAQR